MMAMFWYRSAFQLPGRLREKALYLDLGLIYDVDEVYINGRLLHGSGQFPPNLVKAMNKRRLQCVYTTRVDPVESMTIR